METAFKLLDKIIDLFKENMSAAVAFIFALLCLGMMWLFVWLLKSYWIEIKLGLDKKVNDLSTESVGMKSALIAHGTRIDEHGKLLAKATEELMEKVKDLKEQTQYVRDLSRSTINNTMTAMKKWDSKIAQVEEALANYKETYGRVIHLETRTAKMVDVLNGHNKTVAEVQELLTEIKRAKRSPFQK